MKRGDACGKQGVRVFANPTAERRVREGHVGVKNCGALVPKPGELGGEADGVRPLAVRHEGAERADFGVHERTLGESR